MCVGVGLKNAEVAFTSVVSATIRCSWCLIVVTILSVLSQRNIRMETDDI